MVLLCNFWSTPWGSITIGVISNSIFLGITVLASWGLYNYLNRRSIKSFFGLSKINKISVYVSLIRSWEDKAKSLDNTEMHFSSIAVSYDEFNTAVELKERFKFIVPSLSEKPGILSKLFVSDIQVEVFPSVFNTHEIPMQNTLISVGGPVCNQVTRYIENHAKNRVSLADGTINIKGVGVYNDGQIGVIQKIADRDRCLFYAAGTSTFSTVAALKYLSINWDKLEKRFKKNDFIILVRFAHPDYNPVEIMFEKTL